MLMIHSNVAGLEGGDFIVDRKFHEGMSYYASNFEERIATVHPRWPGSPKIMDMVRVPVSELPYDVLLIDVDYHRRPMPQSQHALEQRIASAELVVGQDFGAAEIARRLGVPYIMIVEYDLGTQIVETTIDQTNPLRRLVRTLRTTVDFYRRQRADIKGAHSIHCNGYPIYHQIEKWHPDRLLYLDSRISPSSVIDEQSLERRLSGLSKRRVRLLFSGRYESLKGVSDVVAVAAECQRRGLPVELSLYGQGNRRGDLERQAAAAPKPEHIHINDAVPFPELMELSKAHDIFVCCHLQSDPSCTYLESFGAGLPIVGYANRMWRQLCAISNAGLSSPMGQVGAVADSIARLVGDQALLAEFSRNARRFALEHGFEREMDKRISGMKQALRPLSHRHNAALAN
jgi:colanic acid/amylovoran biosynthesis glycosyltransferase